jgi:hypothetical protein
MKRFVLVVIIAGLAALGVLYGLRRAEQTPHTAVIALLPRGTIFLAHVPDFNRTRDEWHQSDLYKLYREPAVQEFLSKPKGKIPQRDQTSQTVAQIEKLEPKDGFVAITSIENNNPRFAAGFQFRGSQDDAEKIIGNWRSQVVRDASVDESVDYEKHKIEIVGAAPNQVATVYDEQWFFASNDLAELKAILDRADHRTAVAAGASSAEPDRQSILEADDAFRAAMAHMPASYSLLLYVQPKAFAEKLASLHQALAENASQNQSAFLDRIHSACAATRFDNGKIRDVLFVGMPRVQTEAKLTRSSVALGSADTFFYLATLLNPDKLAGINEPGSNLPLGSWLQKVFDAAARAGVTLEDWKAAFDLELGSLADWPQSARWPSIIMALPVKDPARANKVVNGLTKAIDEDAPWKMAEKGGVQYFYMQSPAALFAITPTVALSNQLLIVGLDSVSVENAIKRAGADGRKSASALESSAVYKAAARAVPAPSNTFVYIDTPLLYSRLDAALRPMLLMSAAFMPAISDYVDIGKLPATEVVTKHLSPIVSSQRYFGDGYVTDSAGPVTLNQAMIGLGLPAVFWAISHQHEH